MFLAILKGKYDTVRIYGQQLLVSYFLLHCYGMVLVGLLKFVRWKLYQTRLYVTNSLFNLTKETESKKRPDCSTLLYVR